jgi:hypothetical protein
LAGIIIFGILLYHIFRDVITTWLGFTRNGNNEFAEMVAALGIGIFGYLSASMFIHAAYPRYFWLLAGVIIFKVFNHPSVPSVRGSQAKKHRR